MAYLENSEEYSMKDIDEVVIGYYLLQDQDEEKLFILEPSWFIISNNARIRISPERIGGTYRGLEYKKLNPSHYRHLFYHSYLFFSSQITN